MQRWQPYLARCNGSQICRYALHASLNAARDSANSALVWTNDGAAMLYDARRGMRLKALPRELNAARLSPDGRWAYRSGYDFASNQSAVSAWKLP
ncbi:hypothetical protein [Deinococcus sp.]|uniref:hypothetical protein n=1 Tax=Deinococcus sp. TaxID=47478 RepID=UPI003C7D95AA